ncbi:TlpA family protein disulfide reductase [Aquamicrobium ahrensii]|uniref:Peroxiredoxin n=1 Tax=Aquamicrobium ahrensii TaxID=469551 RepID=A0ABV2KIQ7_9HYPH
MHGARAPECRGGHLVGIEGDAFRFPDGRLTRCFCAVCDISGIAFCIRTAFAALLAAAAVSLAPPVQAAGVGEALDELRPAGQADAAPPFSLANLSGETVDLSDHRGRPVIVHFFATWCEPCREELPALQRLAARAGEAMPLTVLAISVGEVELRVRRFFTDAPVAYPVLLDEDMSVAKGWGVRSLPATFVLDETLTPRLVVTHDLDWDSIQVERLRERLAATVSE